MDHTSTEAERRALQARLDAARTPAERNRRGQFATPPDLARAIVAEALASLPPDRPLRFLDPAFGTGAFWAALLACAGNRPIAAAVGVEIDAHYGAPARALWGGSGLDLRLADFTLLPPEPAFDLTICNPPYVRHHHLPAEVKRRLAALSSGVAGARVSGLAGLHLHFLLLAARWMAPGGIGAWLVPGEVLDAAYGAVLRSFLRDRVTLLRVHRADPAACAFSDALVSSAVLVFRNAPPPPGHRTRFSEGGSLAAPAAAALEVPPARGKWPPLGDGAPHPAGLPRIGDLFDVRRGIATGANGFFLLDERRVADLGLCEPLVRPILPGPRRLPGDEVAADAQGLPEGAPRVFLLDCALPEEVLRARHPALWAYLEAGRAEVARGFLCSRRTPWYAQERRAPAPILCTYMGRAGAARSNPFRFVRNRSRAIAANVWLGLHPKPGIPASDAFLDAIWRHLAALGPQAFLREGRVYGGGLHKLEPRELAAIPLPADLAAWAAPAAG